MLYTAYVPSLGCHMMKVSGSHNFGEFQPGILLQLLDVGNQAGSGQTTHQQVLFLAGSNLKEKATVVQFRHGILVMRPVRLGETVHSFVHLGVDRVIAFLGKVHCNVYMYVDVKSWLPFIG